MVARARRGDWRGVRVAVVGAGVSGTAVARVLQGVGATVAVTEAAATPELRETAARLSRDGVRVEIGGHTAQALSGCDVVVVSPGVSDDAWPVREARRMGLPVLAEPDVGWSLCRAPIVAVTGTNGKSTTVSLIGVVAEAAGREAAVCGNIGVPFSQVAGGLAPSGLAVVEVSSYQLSQSQWFRAAVAVVLNVRPHHIGRHGDFATYVAQKARLVERQQLGDVAILNHDDPASRSLAGRAAGRVAFISREQAVPGAYLSGHQLVLAQPGRPTTACASVEDLRISGGHNVENALAAALAAVAAGIPVEAIRTGFHRFAGLEHRMESLGVFQGVHVVNDAKSTNVFSGLRALESGGRSIVWMAGGQAHPVELADVLPVVRQRVKAVVLYGESAAALAEALAPSGRPIICVRTLEDATARAFEVAGLGDTVLLSPMCPSFDQFRNFEERGRWFKALVRNRVTVGAAGRHPLAAAGRTGG